MVDGHGGESIEIQVVWRALPGREGVVGRRPGVHSEIERMGVREGVSIPIADGGGVGVRSAGRDGGASLWEVERSGVALSMEKQ